MLLPLLPAVPDCIPDFLRGEGPQMHPFPVFRAPLRNDWLMLFS